MSLYLSRDEKRFCHENKWNSRYGDVDPDYDEEYKMNDKRYSCPETDLFYQHKIKEVLEEAINKSLNWLGNKLAEDAVPSRTQRVGDFINRIRRECQNQVHLSGIVQAVLTHKTTWEDIGVLDYAAFQRNWRHENPPWIDKIQSDKLNKIKQFILNYRPEAIPFESYWGGSVEKVKQKINIEKTNTKNNNNKTNSTTKILLELEESIGNIKFLTQQMSKINKKADQTVDGLIKVSASLEE